MPTLPTEYSPRMAVYDKDKSFSVGWMIGGTVLMFVTNFFGGFVAGAAGLTNIWAIAGIALACFAIAGFVIGWQSEGQTILEAGIAAILAIAIALALRGAIIFADPVALAIGTAVPFGAAVLGAWIGELVQGNTI